MADRKVCSRCGRGLGFHRLTGLRAVCVDALGRGRSAGKDSWSPDFNELDVFDMRRSLGTATPAQRERIARDFGADRAYT
jgi:hypothetical protein